MEKSYFAGGTLRICPYASSPEIVSFIKEDDKKNFDRSKCPHNSECTDESCPLCNHLNN